MTIVYNEYFLWPTYLCKRSWVHVLIKRCSASKILFPSLGTSCKAATKSRKAWFFLSFRSICIHWWCSSFSRARSSLACSSYVFSDFLKFSSSSASKQKEIEGVPLWEVEQQNLINDKPYGNFIKMPQDAFYFCYIFQFWSVQSFVA